MTALSVLAAAIVVVFFAVVAPADAGSSVSIFPYSAQTGNNQAATGASITVTSNAPGGGGGAGASRSPVNTGGATGVSVDTPASGSPAQVEQLGQGSYRYTGTEGRECFYLTEGINTCAGEEEAPAPGPAQPSRPAVSPEAIAVTVSDQLNLAVGGIAASPSAHTAGLTGAASWFWLEPSPTARSVSASLRGEQVTVRATVASVQWSFGDGSQRTAGPGVPYRPDTAPAGAVRHIYRTRCLPGDQGHDPYVLSSCGPNGYHAEVAVQWSITYQASGPVTASGSLPSRFASTSLTYPVNEARAFLTAGGER